MALEMKYFVLKPGKDSLHGQAARNAMLCYAETIASEDPQLAKELEHWVSSIEDDIRSQREAEELAVVEEVQGAYAQEVTPLVLEEGEEEVERL